MISTKELSVNEAGGASTGEKVKAQRQRQPAPVGYALILFAGTAVWFGVIDASRGGSAGFLALPIVTCEIILLPFWLFYRGFKLPEYER